MSSRTIPVQPFALTVFGATGDLARRKLLPALYQRDRVGQLPAGAPIVGTGRQRLEVEAFVSVARAALLEHVPPADISTAELDRFLARLNYVTLDAEGDEGWSVLADLLGRHPRVTRIFYFATGPSLFEPLCARLSRYRLSGGDARVVVEKPLGKDFASAVALNDTMSRVFDERHLYRIDHYLGKETVQNLMALRFANALFEPNWNSAHIDHVQITVAESVGVAGRAGYYDTAGALRDMVQNHLLQLLCLVAMEPVVSLDADAVRDEKLKVLRALSPIDARNAGLVTVRGQYSVGASVSGALPGYLEEVGVSTSDTETFVAIKAEIRNWRWSGTPFYLRTGKRLPARVSEIVIAFRPTPHDPFDVDAGPIAANRLVIRLQPDEGVKLWLMIKDPGPGGMRLQQVPLDMSFATAFGVRNPDAYERLIMDVVRGNQTLFMRRDEVEAAWRWIDPILAAWRGANQPPCLYAAGTWGPSAADALILRDGRTWCEAE
ncbi:glucose-6-phosphate dehydrogenase [Bradyrhizobium sp. SSUT18]|uniref:glucose-6-phosphate dehydrogenase n=1 Tax=Bradyrhizobium sp. SSUT18 TaxID=3040602 RepID=UPI00244C0DEA|nr:glucose-6-phosphate dehydrogenase [Bradyrhizobium sp. SSUT18]MDH2406636.1 glucose-6-phosphate dehydrogenase [Bradyrhizobium sp. SSUT18]